MQYAKRPPGWFAQPWPTFVERDCGATSRTMMSDVRTLQDEAEHLRPIAVFLLASMLVAGRQDQAVPVQPTSNPVRSQLLRLSPNSRLTVKLENGRTMQGRLASVADDSFVLRVSRNGSAADERVNFQDVASVKRGRSTGAKIGLGLAIGAAAFAALMIWYSDNI